MADPTKKNVRVTCAICQGDGFVVGPKGPSMCASCHGYGQYLWNGTTWLTWGKAVDQLHLLEEKIERTTRTTIDALFLAFGIIGAIVGVYGSYSLYAIDMISGGLLEIPRMLQDLIMLRSGYMLVFWLSLLADLYIFYRLDRSRHTVVPVEPLPLVELPPNTDRIEGVEQGKAIDVSLSYTRPSLSLIEQAFEFALRLRHETLEPIHIIAVSTLDNDVTLALMRLGVSHSAIRDRIKRALAQVVKGKEEPRLSRASRAVLARAYERAQDDRMLQVTSPHILEALSCEPSIVQEILFDLKADKEKVHNVVLWALMQRRLFHAFSRLRVRALNKPKGGMDRAMTAQATPTLDHFSTDLTLRARHGTLPLVVDREREIEDVFRVVESGRHNVILVGEKGVGTTSMLYAIAERMAAEDVPEVIQDKRLVQLSVTSLVASTGGAGSLEERLQEIIVEIVKSGNIVLAIEDIHELVGVSTVSGESLDLASILGKVLESRSFVAFATTTNEGYRHYLEPSALFTSFEKINIDEVSPDVAIQILESKCGAVEYRHKVFFLYAAIEKIVELSVRYIHDRRLPEKAFTLLEEVGAYVRASKGTNSVVTDEDAAAVISRRTNANVAAVSEDEATKLLHLEERMHERMVGQDYAVKAVANALRRSRAELRDLSRPIGAFLFLGPTGVGKTELAKTVAEVYFSDERNMIRLDMSEYQDSSSIARLLGAPPGYQGSTTGYLTEAVRVNPFSLILLDELEKAHPDILNVFLQVFDDGRLTDSSGRTIDFTNSIIIATSNAGTDLIQQRIKQGQMIEQIRVELLETTLGRYFRPELLNRFDDVIVFRPLSEEEIEQIAELMLTKIAKRLERRGITLRATPEALHEIAQAGFDPVYGARPLRRVLQENVDNALATFLLTGKLSRRDVAVLEPGGQIRVETAKEL
ncbi:MAG: ATP-dependent Clp protease ATP-binding subunit [Candidatus Kerfeldbacteria bacterium]